MYRSHGLIPLGLLLVALALPVSAGSRGGFNLVEGVKGVSSNVGRSISNFIADTKKTVEMAADKVLRFALVRSSDEEICFQHLGCLSLKYPWVSLSRPLPRPNSPQKVNVQFFLHTRKAPQQQEIKPTAPLQLEGSGFDPEKTTFFLLHGFLNTGNESWMGAMKDAILEKVDGNVFILDWGDGAMNPNFLQVAADSRIVGTVLAWFGKNLIEKGAVPQKFHFIGHSLGAHIASYAAKRITNVARITALDPAGPVFEDQPKMVRLDKQSAGFLDVLHTNAKPLTTLGLGMMEPIGHMDIYVNGGAYQPGCDKPNVTAPANILDIFKNSINVVSDLVSCSHSRSYLYFTEAIRSNCIMWAHQFQKADSTWWQRGVLKGVPELTGPCEATKCVAVGLDAPKYPARGHFSLVTSNSQPFCLAEHSNDGQTLEELRELGLL